MLSNWGSLLARHGILRLRTRLHQAFGRALRTGPLKKGYERYQSDLPLSIRSLIRWRIFHRGTGWYLDCKHAFD